MGNGTGLKKRLPFFFAAVWLVNGLFCKVLNLVPRHQQIVARILGEEYAFSITKVIGSLETVTAVWVLSRLRASLCTVVQMLLVATMNVLEFFLAPDLLLFGKGNMVVAAGFVFVLFWHEDFFRHKPASTFSR